VILHNNENILCDLIHWFLYCPKSPQLLYSRLSCHTATQQQTSSAYMLQQPIISTTLSLGPKMRNVHFHQTK